LRPFRLAKNCFRKNLNSRIRATETVFQHPVREQKKIRAWFQILETRPSVVSTFHLQTRWSIFIEKLCCHRMIFPSLPLVNPSGSLVSLYRNPSVLSREICILHPCPWERSCKPTEKESSMWRTTQISWHPIGQGRLESPRNGGLT